MSKIALKVKTTGLNEITRKNTKQYGEETLGRRAIPDVRDGLKPVNRRILWAMQELGLKPNSKPIKASRVVGDTMGKYHPHGDNAIYEAMVNMAQGWATNNLIDGHGNWGDFSSTEAAHRYTECRLTPFAQEVFLDPNYLAVVPKIPNYDGSEEEPVYLPAKLPNIVLNKGQGIAVGAGTNIPPFKLAGIIKLLRLILKGKKINAKTCLQHLEFDFRNGGVCVSSDADKLAYFKSGEGSLRFTGVAKRNGGTYKITELPPYFNYENFATKALNLDGISSCQEESSADEPICVVVRANKSANPKQINTAFNRLDQIITCSVSFSTNTCWTKTADSFDFGSYNLPDLLNEWIKYRIQLEKDSLAYQIKVAQGEAERLDVLLLAIARIDDLVKIIKNKRFKTSNDVINAIAKLLKVNYEMAEYVFGLTLRRLSNLEGRDLLEQLKKKKQQLRELKERLRKPELSVLTDLKKLGSLAHE